MKIDDNILREWNMDKQSPYIQEADAFAEEKGIAEILVQKEKAALDKWFGGDVSGYAELWSKRSFSYFDAVVKKRVDSHAEIEKFLQTIEGKLFADKYDFREPRVQISLEMAVLTYQLFAKSTLMDMAYNCIEVFQREEDGEWRVLHSTWSCIRPMDVKNWPTTTVV